MLSDVLKPLQASQPVGGMANRMGKKKKKNTVREVPRCLKIKQNARHFKWVQILVACVIKINWHGGMLSHQSERSATLRKIK